MSVSPHPDEAAHRMQSRYVIACCKVVLVASAAVVSVCLVAQDGSAISTKLSCLDSLLASRSWASGKAAHSDGSSVLGTKYTDIDKQADSFIRAHERGPETKALASRLNPLPAWLIKSKSTQEGHWHAAGWTWWPPETSNYRPRTEWIQPMASITVTIKGTKSARSISQVGDSATEKVRPSTPVKNVPHKAAISTPPQDSSQSVKGASISKKQSSDASQIPVVPRIGKRTAEQIETEDIQGLGEQIIRNLQAQQERKERGRSKESERGDHLGIAAVDAVHEVHQ
eukprot:1377533-Rhodomonas_salina.1